MSILDIDTKKNKKGLDWFKNYSFSSLIGKDGDVIRLSLIMFFVFMLMVLLKPSLFLSVENFSSMSFQIPEFGLMAIAMMLVMLTGGIDLSIVGIANLSGILAALVLIRYIPKDAGTGSIIPVVVVSIVISIAAGIVCGLINGLAVTKIGIPPILATLGTMQFFTGIAIVITKGTAVFGFPEQFILIGNGSIGIIPISFLIFIAFAAVFFILLNKTSFGLKLYMLGTNPKSSKFSGINNNLLLIKTYVYSGILASLAGLIIIARTNSAKADYGTSYTLQAILVAVLGGVSPNGGFGKITGIIMAIFTLQFLSSGFNIMHISNLLKDFIWGAVLLLVMIINYFSDNMRNKSKAQ